MGLGFQFLALAGVVFAAVMCVIALAEGAIAGGLIGLFVGYESSDQNELIAGLAGVLLAGALSVVLCWTLAFGLRVQLKRRGYDVSPEPRTSSSRI